MQPAIDASTARAASAPAHAERAPTPQARGTMSARRSVSRKAAAGGTTRNATTRIAPTDSKLATVVNETTAMSM